MQWWLVVFGLALIAFEAGLCVGLFLPRTTWQDVVLNYFLLFSIFVFTLVGLFSVSYGLRK